MQEDEMEHVQEIDGHAEAEGRWLLATAFESAAADQVAGGGAAVDGAELLRRVRRRTTVRRRTRALAPAGAVAALAGAAAVAVTLTATVASAPSAFAAVTAAAAKTSAESFHVTMSIRATAGAVNGSSSTRYRVSGEADPSRGVSEETVTSPDIIGGGPLRLIFTGQDVYVNAHALNVSTGPPPKQAGSPTSAVPIGKPGLSSKPWSETRIFPRLTARQLLTSPGFHSQQVVDPGALLGLLRSAGTVSREGPASGPGWHGTKYGVTLATSGGSSVTGTVCVDSRGQVRRLLLSDIVPLGGGYDRTASEDISFTDFGAPVTVTPPPASQVTWIAGRTTFAVFGW
jgi:hypothetical protein